MKRLLTLSIALSTLVFGFDAEVKKADLKVEINGKLQEFKKGDKFTLKSGDIICFKDGKGSIKITGEDYKKSLNKHIKVCKVMPTIKKEDKNIYVDTSVFRVSNETIDNGMSLMSSEDNITSDELLEEK